MEYHAVVERDLTSIFIDMKGNEKMKKKKSLEILEGRTSLYGHRRKKN